MSSRFIQIDNTDFHRQLPSVFEKEVFLKWLELEHDECIVTKIGGLALKNKSLKKLKSRAWLNQHLHETQIWLNCDLIDGYMLLLQNLNNTSNQPPCMFLSSKHFDYLRDSPNEIWKKWTRKFKFEQQHLIFFPINVRGGHWVAVMADLREYIIYFYDSLNGPGSTYFSVIQSWIERTISIIGPGQWNTEYSRDYPSQRDGFDCGLFVTGSCANISIMESDLSPKHFSPQL